MDSMDIGNHILCSWYRIGTRRLQRYRAPNRVPELTLLLALLFAIHSTAAPAAEAERIAEVLALEPGMRVADVGAGGGRWSELLAGYVGAAGQVYATEIDEDELEKIRQRVEERHLRNVKPILGSESDAGLPEACCDAILLRMVYHHFVDPPRMRTSLRRALRPRGLIAIIDIKPQKHWRQLPDVPDRGGHGIEPEELIAEMTAAGFEVVERHLQWDGEHDRFCIVFRLSSQPAS